MQDARKEFIDAATDMGLNKKSAEKLATQYGLTKDSVDDLNTSIGETPKETKARIKVETAAAAIAINGIKAMLDAVDKDRTINVRVRKIGGVTAGDFVGGGGGTKGFATGTTSAPSGMAWVGEEGPELVKFGGGEQVFTASQSASMARGSISRIPQSVKVASSSGSTVGTPPLVINASGLTSEQVSQGVQSGVHHALFARDRS